MYVPGLEGPQEWPKHVTQADVSTLYCTWTPCDGTGDFVLLAGYRLQQLIGKGECALREPQTCVLLCGALQHMYSFDALAAKHIF
jgi:hypothetical protein